jgi:hypothetical protein
VVCIPNSNIEALLAVIYKSPGHAWKDADIIELVKFGHKSLLAGDVKPKGLFGNNIVSDYSVAKVLNLLHRNEFDISSPQCPSH